MFELKVKLPDTKNRNYQIMIGSGVWDKLPNFLANYKNSIARFVIITDSITKKLFGEKLKEQLRKKGLVVELVAFPAGEKFKTQETKTKLDHQLFGLGCGRDTMVMALGGGVVGDLAGFVAATYMRGIPYIHLPTTILAMVDSSVGGKTSIDTPYGKNLIGAFHQPEAVFADISVLESLPEKQVANGVWEAIKIFLTHDAKMFDYTMDNWVKVLAKDEKVITKIVAEAVKLKVGIVTRDERESGERQVINFGHTVGHALELLSDYKLMHGEAVALGVLVESKISELSGILPAAAFSRITAAVERTGIDKSVLKKYPAREIIEKMRLDKKSRGGAARIVLLEEIGEVYVKENKFAFQFENGLIKKALEYFYG